MASLAARRSIATMAVACLLAASSSVPAASQSPLSLKELLQSLGRYVHEYERAFAAVVSQEDYLQRARASDGSETTRALRSEVALVPADDDEWMVFRDVYQVDGRAVRDRDGRLADLFLTAPADVLPRAKRIADESARYNLGAVPRTLNTPTQALRFLRPENQRRSSFKQGSRRTVGGLDVIEVRFEERDRPRLIYTRDDAAAHGWVWVEPATGAVVRTGLEIASAGTSAVLQVDLVREPKIDMWVPERMTETYQVDGRRSNGPAGTGLSSSSKLVIEGVATYSDYRRFTVDTKTIIR